MMQITPMQEQPGSIWPLQLLTMSEQPQVPAPLVRLTTCGLLTLEIFEEIVSTDPLQARYRVLTPDLLHGRGKVPALTLLKLLVSRPNRFAPADWLLEAFCRAQGEAFSSKRLDTLAWMLRDLLCPSAYQQIRTSLVAHSRGISGPGYRLAGHPLIWVDHEALAWNVEQAIRMERFGDNPLPFWQRAYELAKRGEYLPDKIYGEWSTPKREEIAGLLRQSVQALARLYAEKQDKASEEEALLLLRSYWQQHPRDEDVLRPLMELLGRRDCYQEALTYYEKLCSLLEEDGQQPDSHTQDVVAYLRTKQIRRQKPAQLPHEAHRHDIMRLQQTLAGTMDQSRRTLVQKFLELTGILLFPQGKFLDGETLERLSRAIQSSAEPDETTLNTLENITKNRRTAFVTSEGNTWLEIFQEMQGHLRILTQLLEKSPAHARLRMLAGETALLLGDLLFNAGVNEAADAYYRAAFEVAQGHTPLQVVILGRRALLPIYTRHPYDTLSLIERAQHMVPPTLADVVAAWLWAIAGEAHANLGEKHQCLQALASAEDLLARGRTGESSFHFHSDIAYATFSGAKLFGYKGVCLLHLHCTDAAQDILNDQLAHTDPQTQLHHTSIALIDLASSFVQQTAIRQACEYAKQSLGYLEQTQSLRVFQRLLQLRQSLDPWENTAPVRDLDEKIHHVALSVGKR
jgi:DNA-binding SARP family transcriptional activator